MSFGIKDGYQERPTEYFLDNLKETRGIVFQPDVYTLAELLCDIGGITQINDLGCGQGDKLAAIHERHPDWDLIGYDFGANIQYCRVAYDWGTWVDVDLEHPLTTTWGMVICSDVIEHLANPVVLLESILDRFVVLSTPERDLQHGVDHMGPSPNINHVREWNYQELHTFLENLGFHIKFHGLTRSSDQGPYCQTQIVVM